MDLPLGPLSPPPPGLLTSVTARLAAAGCVAAQEEAEELLAGIGAGTDPGAAGPVLEEALGRRESGEPLAWITGRARFCGHEVGVDTGVFVPRPQSEELAARAGRLLAEAGAGARAVDLCTGAGPVALHCIVAAPTAQVIGVDRDPRAAACARRNGVPVVLGDLGSPLADGCANVVTAVAPYVPTSALAFLPADVQRYEPSAALDGGGGDGLHVVRRVVADARRLLRPGGWLLVEIGGDQERGVRPTLEDHGFGGVDAWCDDEGDLRGLVARLGRR